MSEISFADLRCRFQTGRSYAVSGEGIGYIATEMVFSVPWVTWNDPNGVSWQEI